MLAVLVYHIAMNKKCRILLIFVVIGLISVGVFFCLLAYNKYKSNNTIYARSINFVEGARNYEICIENSIILNKDIVTITPSNYSFDITFEIKKTYNPDKTPATTIKLDTPLKFSTTGKYRITCKAISGSEENNFITDYIYISVVANPSDTTTMYIKSKEITLTVNSSISLNEAVNITKPAIAETNILCNENISFSNNTLTALNVGAGIVDIKLKYYSLILYKQVAIAIKPIIEASDLSLTITYGTQLYNDNDTITIIKTNSTINLNYIINNCDNQQINSWCDNGLQILPSFPPSIIVKADTVGAFNLYISPKDYADIIFKVILNIVE